MPLRSFRAASSLNTISATAARSRDAVVEHDVLAETFGHRVEHRAPRRLEVAGDLIGIDDDGAAFGEHRRHGRLAGADASGQTRPGSPLRCLPPRPAASAISARLPRRGSLSAGSLGGSVPRCGLGSGLGGAFATFAVVLGPCCFGLCRRFALDPVAGGVDLEVLAVLGGEFATFGGLLDRQADAATGEVEIDDLHPQLFARA